MLTLQRKVLVLNKDWTAINTCTVKKALTMLFKGSAIIIDQQQKTENNLTYTDFQSYSWEDWAILRPAEGENCIISANSKFRVPEVIRLTRYGKYPSRKVKFSRKTIFKRDNYTCCYCGKKPKHSDLSIDHIISRHHGGKTTWDNVCLACTACNCKKANKTMIEAGMKFFDSKYKPTKPNIFLFDEKIKYKSWKNLLNNCYWNIELENDNE